MTYAYLKYKRPSFHFEMRGVFATYGWPEAGEGTISCEGNGAPEWRPYFLVAKLT